MIAEYSVNLENKTKSELILFIKELQDMLKEKDEQIAKYEKIYKEYDCYRWVKELEKKDKIIDLMAETIRKLAISLANYKGSYNKETINFTGNIKGIKQYFERKATKLSQERKSEEC